MSDIRDADFEYERTRENAQRVATALEPFDPRPRGFPKDVAIIFDAQTLLTSEVLTLETSAGDVDLLAKINGLGTFDEVDALAETLRFEEFGVRVLSVEGLINSKLAAGRPKDQPGLIELETIREAREFDRLEPPKP